MGSLSLAGAAGGIGKSLQRTVAFNRQMEMDEAEREHDRQLEAMRDKHARERMDIQYERDLGMAETQRTHQLGMAETRAEHEFGMQMNDQALQVWKTNADNESDEWQTAFGAWSRSTSGAAGTSRKAGEWDVEFTEIFDMTTGTTKTGMRASHPNGTAIEQHGKRMIPVSLSDEEKQAALAPWKDEQKRLEAESKLLKDLRDGNDSSEWFLESFGYLPSSYYRAKFEMSDDSKIKEFMESFRRSRSGPDMPYQYQGTMPRSTPDRMGVGGAAGGGAEPTPIEAIPGEIKQVVAQAAEQEGIDPYLLMAKLTVESNLDPNALSDKGAEGIAQFMPDTAAEMGIDPTNPNEAIPAAARYIKQMLDHFDGDYAKAMAGYNWGHNREEYADKDWLAKAPEETRNHVAKIMNEYMRLRQNSDLFAAPEAEAATLPEASTQPAGGGGVLSEAVEAEATPAPAPTPAPTEPEEKPGLVITQQGEVTEQQAQQIADAVSAIMQGEAPGPSWGERTKSGLKSWLTGGYSDELGMYVSGSEEDAMERKYGPDWMNNEEAINELRAKKGK